MDARSTETKVHGDECELGPPQVEEPEWGRLSKTKPDLSEPAIENATVGRASGGARSLGWSRQWFWLLIDRARQWRQHRYLTPDAALGRRGEDLAHRFLRAHGLTVVARNFTLPNCSGEIDIVARDGDVTVFVEVKSRMTDQYGAPERAIGPDKQERITRAAEYYCYRANVQWDRVRFDVVSIVFGATPKVTHTVDAFFLRRAR